MSLEDTLNLPKGSLAMLLSLILFCFVFELIGGSIMQQTIDTWYQPLHKPDWILPSYLFAPIWTLLYLVLAFAMWLVWLIPSTESKTSAYILFSAQLILNLLWSVLFFYFNSPILGLIDNVILFVVVISTAVIFYRIRPVTGLILIPYIIWMAYLIALNAAIWYLNKEIVIG